ncbi:MAG TPA: hypothetical protein VME22_03685 [Solirubrobacteraceae bacterium]|nr:hypothetical protein [Solirubrobacteraceae bacterium]
MNAMIYAENGDIIGTYGSREEAIQQLESLVDRHPGVQDEVGLRPYHSGRPVGEYESEVDLLGDRMTQQHLI